MFYIWGFVVLFGWVVFVGLGVRRIVLVVLVLVVTNVVVVIG